MVTELLAGRYRPLREVGRGGMATVYLALDEKHRREVALKLLRPELAREIGAERFLREVEITAALNHPHILPLLDSGAEDGLLWYAMPYVPGGSLRRLLGAGPLPLEAVTRIVREVASALDHAHARGIVHRDIKPENILFSDGLAVVTDFGIARAAGAGASGGRMTATGLPLGTPGYMSPEQALGAAEVDARTDVYALGAVAFEMLVGETPAAWPGAEDVSLGRFAELPPAQRARLDPLPGRVEQALVRALALRPQHRFAAAGQLAAALAAAAQPGAALGDDAVQRLLRRAAELQAQAPEPPPGGLTIGAVEQVAAQVGIPPVHVRAAARELEGSAAVAPAATEARGEGAPAAPDWRRLRERWNRLAATEQLAGALPDAAFPAMVAEIERRLGMPGHTSILSGTLTWTPAPTGVAAGGPLVHVTARGGTTTIRVQEDLTVRGLHALIVPIGMVFGGWFGAVLGRSLGAPALAFLGLIAGGILALWGAVNVTAAVRAPALAQLARALAALARGASAEAARPLTELARGASAEEARPPAKG